MSGAAHHRGSSRQDFGTPVEFVEAVVRRFGPLAWDLAASPENKKAPNFLHEGHDSLSVRWANLAGNELLWLNPPFANIAPWAQKCLYESDRSLGGGAHILFLVPAAVGANWWARSVHEKALVHFLNGRLSFDGKNPYPKDCALCEFGPDIVPGYSIWPWKLRLMPLLSTGETP